MIVVKCRNCKRYVTVVDKFTYDELSKLGFRCPHCYVFLTPWIIEIEVMPHMFIVEFANRVLTPRLKAVFSDVDVEINGETIHLYDYEIILLYWIAICGCVKIGTLKAIKELTNAPVPDATMRRTIERLVELGFVIRDDERNFYCVNFDKLNDVLNIIRRAVKYKFIKRE